MQKMSSVCLLAGFCLACGSDGDEKSDSSGIPADKKVTAFTDEDAQRWCNWVEGLVAGVNITDAQACTIVAWEESSTTEQCIAARDECVDYVEPEVDTVECADLTADDINVPDECANVTVAQIEACLRGYLEAYASAANMATCEDPDSVDDQSLPVACGEGGELLDCVPG